MVNFATAGKVIQPAAISPVKLTAMVKEIDLKSIDAGARSLREIKLQPRQVSSLMSDVYKSSPANALKLSRVVLEHAQSSAGDENHARALFQWGQAQGRAERQVVCSAFRQAKLDIVAVHHIAELTQKDAQGYMKDYFEAGGDLGAVLQWLQVAGGVLRENLPSKPEDTAGDAVKWVGDKLKEAGGKVVDAAKGMINTVVDAVKAAGKSLVHVVEEAAKWTADKLRDLMHALIAAGKAVGEILSEAVKQGLAALDKFVKALLAAGRSVLSVLQWAAAKALDVLTAAVNAILAAGRTVAQLLAQAIQLAASALKAVVQVLYRIGKKVAEILVAVASSALSIIRTVLEGLLAIGVKLAESIVAICTNVAEQFRKGFFQGLIALGKTPLEIIKAAATAGASMAALAFAVIMEVFGGHRPLNASEIAEARKVFGWSIPLDRVKLAVASVPADLINWINGNRTFTTMYVINFASWDRIDQNMHTLIHELTHVWQATTAGPVYMVEALCSQAFGKGYTVTDADLAAAKSNFSKLEREQQAVVVENYWWGRWGGSAIDWKKYQALAQTVYKPQPVKKLVRVPGPAGAAA
jgi:hypothetical protein